MLKKGSRRRIHRAGTKKKKAQRSQMSAGFGGKQVSEWRVYGNYRSRSKWRSNLSRGRQPLPSPVIFGGMHKIHSLAPCSSTKQMGSGICTSWLNSNYSVWGFQNKIVSVYMVKAMPLVATVVSLNQKWWYHIIVASGSQCFLPFLPSHVVLPGSLCQAYLKFKKKLVTYPHNFLRDHDVRAIRGRESKR